MDRAEQDAIRAVQCGDRDAFRILMERHYRTVHRVAFRITNNAADAEEATQEAFLRAFRKLAGFREEAGFGTWVTRIAINAALTLAERRSREKLHAPHASSTDPSADPFSTLPDGSAGPERLLLDRETERLRQDAMAALTPMERTAFTMRHMEDLPIAEIALALQVPANSAKQAIFRAVGKLRSALAPTVGGTR